MSLSSTLQISYSIHMICFYVLVSVFFFFFFFFSSRRRHTRLTCDWSSDVCSSDLLIAAFWVSYFGWDWFHGYRNQDFRASLENILILRGIGTVVVGAAAGAMRSEERRVGKECRSRWSRDD